MPVLWQLLHSCRQNTCGPCFLHLLWGLHFLPNISIGEASLVVEPFNKVHNKVHTLFELANQQTVNTCIYNTICVCVALANHFCILHYLNCNNVSSLERAVRRSDSRYYC